MLRRRALLVATTATLVGATGCIESIGTSPDEGAPATDGTPTGTPDQGGTPTAGAAPALVSVSGGNRSAELVTYAQVASVGEVEPAQGGYRLPITLSEAGARSFEDGLESVGALENPEAYDLRLHHDGSVVFEATLGPGLAESIREDEWEDHRFLLQIRNESTAREVKEALED